MVSLVRVALGFVACVVAGAVVSPGVAHLSPVGRWGTALDVAAFLVAAYAILAFIEWLIGGVPPPRHRRRQPR